MSVTFVWCNLRAEFECLHNGNYVSRILDSLRVFWSLFGSIWSRPDEDIGETNSVMQHIWLTLTGQIRQNEKKPVFVVVCTPFSYLDEFFHDFRTFPQTLVNIWNHVPNFDHYWPWFPYLWDKTNRYKHKFWICDKRLWGLYWRIFSEFSLINWNTSPWVRCKVMNEWMNHPKCCRMGLIRTSLE